MAVLETNSTKKIVAVFNSRMQDMLDQYREWSSLATHFGPKRMEHNPLNPPARSKAFNSEKVYDPKPILCAKMLGLAISSFMAPQTTYWYAFAPIDGAIRKPSREERQWCYGLREKVSQLLASSGFYRAFLESCQDKVVFGPSYMVRMLVGNRYFVKHIPFYQIVPVRDFWGEYRGFYRVFWKTAEQIRDQFGIEVRGKKGDDLCKVLHYVNPRSESSVLPQIFEWESQYIAVDTFQVLSQGGYRGNLYIPGSWDEPKELKESTGVAYNHLASARILQNYAREMLASGMLKNRPPTIWPNQDMTLAPEYVPGAIWYYDSIKGEPKPVDLGMDPRTVESQYIQLHKGFEDGFYLSYILPILFREGSSPYKAAEVWAKRDDAFRVIGQQINAIEREDLSPVLLSTAEMLIKYRLYDPPPKSMGNTPIHVEYSSAADLALRSSELEPINRWLQFFQVAASFDSRSLATIDVDYMLRKAERVLQMDPLVLKDEQSVQAALRKMEQEQTLQQLATAGTAVREFGQGAAGFARADGGVGA